MKNKKAFAVLVVFMISFVTLSQAQSRPRGNVRIQNGIGIMGAATQFDIITDNFETKAGNSWLLGASATVDIPHKWYNVSYSIQLSESKIEIAARPQAASVLAEEYVEYKMFAAQIALMAHIKIVSSYLTLDLGPMLQYNDKLQMSDKNQENFILNGYDTLLASEISDISRFNVNGTVGLTAGYEFIKLRAQYIYGFTNILNKLNDKNLDTTGTAESKFKGNQSMWLFGIMVSF